MHDATNEFARCDDAGGVARSNYFFATLNGIYWGLILPECFADIYYHIYQSALYPCSRPPMSVHGYINYGDSRVPACNTSETIAVQSCCYVLRSRSFRCVFSLPLWCQRIKLPTIAASSSSTAILYHGLYVTDMPAAESVLNIRSLIHSPSRITIARSLRDEEAQGFIDFIDRVSDTRYSVTVS